MDLHQAKPLCSGPKGTRGTAWSQSFGLCARGQGTQAAPRLGWALAPAQVQQNQQIRSVLVQGTGRTVNQLQLSLSPHSEHRDPPYNHMGFQPWKPG